VTAPPRGGAKKESYYFGSRVYSLGTSKKESYYIGSRG